jgi:FK506-binding protein 1
MATELKKEIIKEGNKTDKPQNGDTVTMEYTGWLFEEGKDKNRGDK